MPGPRAHFLPGHVAVLSKPPFSELCLLLYLGHHDCSPPDDPREPDHLMDGWSIQTTGRGSMAYFCQ